MQQKAFCAEAIRLLKAVRVTSEEATLQEKRTILRPLYARVHSDGELQQLSGGAPVQLVRL